MNHQPPITSRQIGDVHILRVGIPELSDRDLVLELERTLAEYLRAHRPAKWVMDFGDVRFITSEMLGTMLRLNKVTQDVGSAMELSNMAKPVRDVFCVTKLDRLFAIVDGPAGAIDQIRA